MNTFLEITESIIEDSRSLDEFDRKYIRFIQKTKSEYLKERIPELIEHGNYYAGLIVSKYILKTENDFDAVKLELKMKTLIQDTIDAMEYEEIENMSDLSSRDYILKKLGIYSNEN